MRRVVKFLIVLATIISLKFELKAQDEMLFSIGSEFCSEILGFSVIKNDKLSFFYLVTFLVLPAGIIFVYNRKKYVELISLIIIILIVLVFFPFFDFRGEEIVF